MRIFVKGFGCSSSLADSEIMAGCLASAGHALVKSLEDSELVIYNTCAVKSPTENRMINMLKILPKDKKIIVAGCLPFINFKRLHREVRFDGVVGPAFGEKIIDVVEKVSRGIYVERLEKNNMPSLELPQKRSNPLIGVIPISYGCVGTCSYCCVRNARGKLRSYSIEDIMDKIRRDLGEGVKEFWLTSQDTGSYGKDLCSNLAILLSNVFEVKGDFRVRVGMMTPNSVFDIVDELIEVFQNEKCFNFLHIPVQSGDDRVLENMNRKYTTMGFLDIVKKFRERIKLLTVATDVIVGFPGETKKAFQNTVKLIKNVEPDIVNISKFFGRPKTNASELDSQISIKELKTRSVELSRLVNLLVYKKNRSWIGWSGPILVDEIGKFSSIIGRNIFYKPIVIKNIDGNLDKYLGESLNVRIIDAFQSHLLSVIS